MALSKKILLLSVLFFHFTAVKGQTSFLLRHSNKDTAYIREFYRKHLVIRAYESTKFNNFKLIDEPNKLVYKPNDHNVFGLGFNYRFISINIGLYVPSVGKSIDEYGKTHQLDLQTHLYYHKFIVDLYGQFYKGYYLSDDGATPFHYENDAVEKRPDIFTRDISVVFQYLFNDQRFSYNAAFYQNERQKKSAGSFLLGGGIYHTDVKGDSSLVPGNVSYNDFFRNNHFNATGNTAIGFNFGYGYTVVIKKLFFITASLSGGAGISSASLSNTNTGQKDEKLGLGINSSAKFAAGYNSDNYFAGITYIRLVTDDNCVMPHTWLEDNTGNFRFIIAKRFRLKKTLIPKSELLDIE